jgi:fimbrial chaperone protein
MRKLSKSFTLKTAVVSGFILSSVLGLGSLSNAMAGTFSVTPVRIFVAPRDRATAVTITNEGNEPLVMNVELYNWKQNDKGDDVLTLTEDLVVSSPVVKLAPKSRQVIRLALLRPKSATEQLTYRIIVSELIEARAANPEKVEVPLALAFSMPIFITPKGALRNVVCGVERVDASATKVVCENSGNAYSHVREFELTSASGEKIAEQATGGYLLAGTKRSFDLKPAASSIPAGAAKLKVVLENGLVQTFDVTLAK